MGLFQNSVLRKHLASQNAEACQAAYDLYVHHFHNPRMQAEIRGMKEEEYQDGFLSDLFVKILGYTKRPNEGFDLIREKKNETDSKKADGAILRPDESVIAIIELKGTDTKDLSKVNDQAFRYQKNHPDCPYVITSNFEKLRFFIDNAVEHEEFNLFTLTQERFSLLWLCLQKDNLQADLPKKIKVESLLEEERVTKLLYKDYSAFKSDLWQDMCQQNPEADELELYKKSQKLLDRFLFIFFAEDKGLLPPNSITQIVKEWAQLKELDAYSPLYDRIKLHFGYMNNGRPRGQGKEEIYAYNGGLFKADALLDALTISDDVLKKYILKLTEYDFDTEVDTNILGHIFEHSLNDIENVRAQLAGEELDKSKTKRKKDGVFYTPKYITKYIVDNSVGKLCEEKKTEIGIDEEEFAKDRKGRRFDTLKRLDAQLKQYREWLLKLTICDPACGSGAFLNQTLEFLMAEHRYVDELESQLLGYAMVFQDVENHILERNIYGVDINEESVEIARLSLWLRTAKKGRKLTSLSSNIKVGNSLIDDPEVAGELAFNWQEQFPTVFEKGGFDVVIGNPPYVRQELIAPFKPFLKKRYQTFAGTADLYTYFIEMGVDTLINNKGFYSIIVGNKWMRARFASKLRLWMKEKEIVELVDFGDLPVFKNVAAYPVIVTLKKKASNSSNLFYACEPKDLAFDDLNLLVKSTQYKVDADMLQDDGWSLVSKDSSYLLAKLKKVGITLSQYVNQAIYRGVLTGLNDAFVIDGNKKEELIKSDPNCAEVIKPFVAGRDIKRYRVDYKDTYLILLPSGYTNSKCQNENGWDYIAQNLPSIANHLLNYKDQLIKRSDQGEYWWELRACAYYDEFEKQKLLLPDISTRGNFVLDSTDGYFVVNTAYIIGNADKYLLGILNSKLVTFYYKNISPTVRGGYLRFIYQYLVDIPIAKPENRKKQEFVSLIEGLQSKINIGATISKDFIKLLQSKFPIDKPSKKLQNWPQLDFKGFLAELKKKKVKLSLDEEAEWLTYFNKKKTEANALQAEIDRVNKQIDQMVYELYGLSEEEINIVEAS